MLNLRARRIFLALGITDMRKSIQGLATLAAQADEGRVPPLSGYMTPLFIKAFYNSAVACSWIALLS